MKHRLSIALCAALVALALMPRGLRADENDRPRLDTVVVQTVLPNGQAAIGAGVVVARTSDTLTIATAAHALVGPPDALRILDTTRRAYYVVLSERVLPDYDLALVQVRAQQHEITPVETASPVVGEDVVVIGHHDGAFWTSATARVLSTDLHMPSEFGSARIAIRCDACAHGDSGAGVFDRYGRLIGMLTKAWRGPDGAVRFIEVEPAALLAQEAQAQQLMAAAPAGPRR